MLIPLDIVNYNLGSSCLIIDISILCLGAMRSECVPTWTKHGVAEEMAVLRTLLHALTIWIVLLLGFCQGLCCMHLYILKDQHKKGWRFLDALGITTPCLD
ncbi:uncharacterized protein LOC123395786 isoform X2 [Hordeum vulgare subsp. vulgare]|uniref:uncharacterized protein LOC123395786 isoform X2 n=1 Tax=Hordeum vulgare subsp. vulgare TaxID=112509 RepID=UPI001D1A3814|nr:uncharacterized protein LOC123395786 isoform X2 [Hordeum vulgare subsp. vulgare]